MLKVSNKSVVETISQQDILFTELSGDKGDIGLVTLNRPSALNAVNTAMCFDLRQKLIEWQEAPNIKAVIVQGAGDKAFCAGGDIRSIYDSRTQPVQIKSEFFWHEYRLNRQIFHFSKPYIALLDGITMGGGLGVSVHGSHRIATDKLKWAMPETTIGFYPDVGGSYFLPRCRDKMGIYAALTGVAFNAADACYVGIADYLIESKAQAELITTLVAADFGHDAHAAVDRILQQFAKPAPKSSLADYADIINTCFSQPSVSAILSALHKYNQQWRQDVVDKLNANCSLSLQVTLQQLQYGEKMDFDACMRMEFNLTRHFMQGATFYEGIRAAIIDKDKKPRWQPNELAKVTDKQVNHYFTSFNKLELQFD